jgi:LysR family hydrogen peroxide-inducible transcriptional activator
MRPSIQQLEAFLAVARTLNFRQAADETQISQPALSAQIQKLEAALDTQLFERDRRRVLITPAGEAILPLVREILDRTDELVVSARGEDGVLHGTLRLGVIPTVAPYALPRVLPAVRRGFADVRVLVREDQTGRLLDRLQDGRLDVLFLALEAELGDVERLPVFRDAFVLAMAPGHPLAARETVAREDLDRQELLLLEDGHCLRQQALDLCRGTGAHELGDFRATSLPTLVQMVASGIGVTLLPEVSLRAEVREGELEVRRFAPPEPFRTLGLAWRAGSPRRAAFTELGRLFESSL